MKADLKLRNIAHPQIQMEYDKYGYMVLYPKIVAPISEHKRKRSSGPIIGYNNENQLSME